MSYDNISLLAPMYVFIKIYLYWVKHRGGGATEKSPFHDTCCTVITFKDTYM